MAQSSNSRLTINQKCLFANILDLFGDDVKKNFIAMLTFCDNGKPPIINTLDNSDNIFIVLISYLKSPWYFKFNNSSIFESDRDGEFTKMFFKINMKNFKEFTQKLIKMPRKSLDLTKQALEERFKLEENVELLYSKLREDKMEYNINMECINIQNLIIKSINKLQKIALNKNIFETSEDYIELLIENEKFEFKNGWQKIIEELEHLKQLEKMIREIYKGENQKMNDMKKFIKDYYLKKKIAITIKNLN